MWGEREYLTEKSIVSHAERSNRSHKRAKYTPDVHEVEIYYFI